MKRAIIGGVVATVAIALVYFLWQRNQKPIPAGQVARRRRAAAGRDHRDRRSAGTPHGKNHGVLQPSRDRGHHRRGDAHRIDHPDRGISKPHRRRA